MSWPQGYRRRWELGMLLGMRVGRRFGFWLADSGAGERALRRLPGGEALAWRAASRYVAGRTRAEALTTAVGLVGGGSGVSLDLVGERVADVAEADRVTEEYVALAGALPRLPTSSARERTAHRAEGGETALGWLSVDLTHLGLDAGVEAAAERLTEIVKALPHGARLQVGAEDAARTDATLACLRKLPGDRLGATVPANLMRSPTDLDELAERGFHVRLVKGAYLGGTGTYPYGEETDRAYRRLAQRLAERGGEWSMATHDQVLREQVLAGTGTVTVEQLLGVHAEQLGELRARGVPTRVYVPYGPGWLRYWLRRAAEARGT